MSDWFTLLPAVVAIGFVLWRKEVVVALILAIFCSEWLLGMQAGDYSPFSGFIQSIERTVAVFGDPGNARLLTFSTIIGGLLAFMRFSGGVDATVKKMVNSGLATTPRRAGLMTFFTGVVVFIESNLSVLTAGILSRGLFDRFMDALNVAIRTPPADASPINSRHRMSNTRLKGGKDMSAQ